MVDYGAIYKLGIICSYYTALGMFIPICLYRFYQTFITFASGEKMDSFEESCLICWADYKRGNEVFGTTMDMVLYVLILGVIVLTWPISWIIVILSSIAANMRKNAIEQQKLVDILKGDKRNTRDHANFL